MPHVSVVIPLYNKAEHIQNCLRSVAEQTFADFEAIVVDDGSSDAGPNLVENFTDPRFRLIRQENGGPGMARNRGIAEATTEWVAFLDADDEWLPEFLEKSLSVLHTHPECDLAVSSVFEQSGELTDMTGIHQTRGVQTGPWRFPTEGDPARTRSHIRVLCSDAIVCRRSLLEHVGGFYTTDHCTAGEDTYLWIKLCVVGTVYYLLEPLSIVHVGASQLGAGRPSAAPPKPYLVDEQQIRQLCPPERRQHLEALLYYWARLEAGRLIIAGNPQGAVAILKHYPRRRSDIVHFLLCAGARMSFALPRSSRFRALGWLGKWWKLWEKKHPA